PNGGENWQAGTSHDITWSGFNSGNIKIEYCDNYLGSKTQWKTVTTIISQKIFSYSWAVPNTPSANCKVRINNGLATDESDNVFTISSVSQSKITVISPNGGESWEVGSTQSITWESNNVKNVKIVYGYDNKGTPVIKSIIESISSKNGTNKYSWNIPNTTFQTCRVMITDVANSSLYDYSDNEFAIVAPTPQSSITVTSPNGGENWQAGTSHNITWTSNDVSNVKIEYSINNGTNWTNLVSSTPSDGSYSWTIPNTPSTSCKVRISDASNSTVNNQSNNVFTISSPLKVTVTSPNGGEDWQVGSSHDITWTSTSVSNVKIEYSTNNGTNWTGIVSSTSSDGSYSWKIPNTPSTNCKVRVSDASNSTVNDQSNNVFTISTKPTPTITVTSPNGSEDWQVGSSHNITWSSNDVSNVKIEYSTNNGTNWTNIISSTTSDGSYNWTIPNTPSTNCKVRISDASNSSVYDQSNNIFTISSQPTPTITVTSPNGGENWQAGTSQNITWTSNDVDIVKIDFSTNNGTDWKNIVSSTLSDGSYTWTVLNTPSTSCRVRIYDTLNSSVNDQSDNVFEITGLTTTTKRSAQFSSAGDFIDVPHSPSLALTEFTIEFWLKVQGVGDANAADGEQTILDKRGDDNTGFNLRLAGTTFPISLIAIALPGDVSAINKIFQNVWYHIAITQDKSKLKLYLNGELIGENSNTYAWGTEVPLRIGEFLGYPGAYLGLHGQIDELCIWDNACSQDEIKSGMNKKLNGTEEGLVACWNFDNRFGATIPDLSPNGNNGTITGNVKLIDSDELYTAVDETKNIIPEKNLLSQNYPNPFNPSTTIEFQVKEPSFVTLKIYNVLGNEVVTIVKEQVSTGYYKYHWDGTGMASGVYFYKLQAGNYSAVKKMLLMK
ncbi:MAG: LamG-like jellyroll fold domain-containing protein, partial [Ignavibacteriaceae bacterium]